MAGFEPATAGFVDRCSIQLVHPLGETPNIEKRSNGLFFNHSAPSIRHSSGRKDTELHLCCRQNGFWDIQLALLEMHQTLQSRHVTFEI